LLKRKTDFSRNRLTCARSAVYDRYPGKSPPRLQQPGSLPQVPGDIKQEKFIALIAYKERSGAPDRNTPILTEITERLEYFSIIEDSRL
jgi:hypothetical protein